MLLVPTDNFEVENRAMQWIAKPDTCLEALIHRAIPLCQAAERQCPRTGPGRPPEIPDWVMAVLIVAAVLKQRKSKSSQYRFLAAHRARILKLLKTDHFPARSTYFDRYHRAWKIYEVAIRLAGDQAIDQGLANPRCVAVDKSVVETCGPKWNKRHVARDRLPRGADLDATWTFSSHHGWTLGYAYEVVVTAARTGPVWPLVASAEQASWQPSRTFPAKVGQLPKATRYVLADSGYDSTDLADMVELDQHNRSTGRRLLCPYPKHRRGTSTGRNKETIRRKQRRRRRRQRAEFFRRPFSQNLIRRRGTCVEPFNDWLKTRFDLHKSVWHRGLANNRTQLLAAIFAYQLLLFFNHACGHNNARLQWILDAL